MGGVLFALQFSDGSMEHLGCGSAVDFINYPPGKSGTDIVKVMLHHRTEHPHWGPEYVWCIFDGIEGGPAKPISERGKRANWGPWLRFRTRAG